MDEVQKFVANNLHQFGYIMQEASRQWIAKDPTGALTVGPCNISINRYGDYYKLLDKNEKLQAQLDAKILLINNGWEEERYVLQERVLRYEKVLKYYADRGFNKAREVLDF
jgi:hypothetical protein